MINIGDFIDNRYRVLEMIGSGGMANVFVANDIINNSFVAIKIMKEELLSSDTSYSDFKKEIETTASLSHNNIVKVFNAGEYEKCPYLVTEYFKDQTISNRLDFLTKFPLKEAIGIMIQLLDAIQYTHNHKLIHRDIKPQNIFYFSNGIIKLGDYGIALSDTLSNNNKILGSIHYLAPEIFKGYSYSTKSDIYSAGITMFQLISGKLPFEERTIEEVKKDHLYKSFPHISKIITDIPSEIDDIILKATAKKPGERYASAIDFKNDLISFQNGTYKKRSFLDKLLGRLS